MSHWWALLTGAGTALAALLYIAAKVGRGVRLLGQLGDMPRAHAQLAHQTEVNTAAIDHLTEEVKWLRAALTMNRGRRG